MAGFLRKWVALLMGSLIASWLWPHAGFSHGEPAQLAFWGNFSTRVSACQRALGEAAESCVARAVRARTECRLAVVDGTGCDEDAFDAEIQAARARARAFVRGSCSELDVQNLRYIDIDEALRDVIAICRSLDGAIDSAVFALAGANEAIVDAEDRACVEITARQTSKLLAFAMNAQRAGLDRIAATNVPFTEKQSLIDRALRRIGRGAGVATKLVEDECSVAVFQRLYGRSAEAHLRALAEQADCYGGAVYVQDALVCPDPTCGNGIEEEGESCDDGNAADGDGCSALCGVEVGAETAG